MPRFRELWTTKKCVLVCHEWQEICCGQNPIKWCILSRVLYNGDNDGNLYVERGPFALNDHMYIVSCRFLHKQGEFAPLGCVLESFMN